MSSSEPSKGATAIVVVIAVLIVLIPVGFLIKCILVRYKNINGGGNLGVPLPD